MDANALGTQLGDIQSKMSQYTGELPGQIKEEVRKAWSPSLQEASGVVGQQLSEFLPKYFGMGEALGGTSAADISPTKRLQQMGTYMGELGGNLTSASSYADYLGANMKSAYEDALTAANMGYQNLADQYGQVFNQYQLAWQQAEAEKDRQLQRDMAAQSGSGGTVINWPEQGTEQEVSDLPKYTVFEALTMIQTMPHNTPISERKMAVDSILSNLAPGSQLPSDAAYRMAGITGGAPSGSSGGASTGW